jgi:hypothetical protein
MQYAMQRISGRGNERLYDNVVVVVVVVVVVMMREQTSIVAMCRVA